MSSTSLLRVCLPAMSRAPSLLDSVPPASSPTKPTFSFFWSACAPGNTPPFRDFCTMTERLDPHRPTIYFLPAHSAPRSVRPGGSIAAEEKVEERRKEVKRRINPQRYAQVEDADQQIFFSLRLPAQKGNRMTSPTVIDQAHRLQNYKKSDGRLNKERKETKRH